MDHIDKIDVATLTDPGEIIPEFPAFGGAIFQLVDIAAAAVSVNSRPAPHLTLRSV